MFSALFSRLTGPATPDPELDAQFAIVALLVRIAKADAHYAFEEIAEIDRIIGRTWGLNAVAAMKLRAQAERIEAGIEAGIGAGAAEATAPRTEDLTRLVQDHTPYDQRLAIYDALWDVSLADRKLHDSEGKFLDGVTAALGITAADKAAAAARHAIADTDTDTDGTDTDGAGTAT